MREKTGYSKPGLFGTIIWPQDWREQAKYVGWI